jgi:hypothetical protein
MVMRAATAKEIDGLIDEWQEAAGLFDIGAKAVEEVSRKTAPTNGTAACSMNGRMELSAAELGASGAMPSVGSSSRSTFGSSASAMAISSSF